MDVSKGGGGGHDRVKGDGVRLGATLAVVAGLVLTFLVNVPAVRAADPFEVVATISVSHTSKVVVSGGYALVASDSTISVIDTTSNTIVRTVATGGVNSPVGAAASGTQVFFAAAGSDQLVTLDTQTWSVAVSSTNVTGDVCDKPVNLFLVSQSRLVVDCETSNSIQIYDISGAPTIVDTVSVEGSPRLMSASGDVVFVPNISANSVSIVDTGIANPTATNVGVGARPNSTAYLDGKIFAANFDGNSVSILNAESPYSSIATLTVGTQPQELEPCAGNIYTANRATGDTSVISPLTNTVVNTIPLAGGGSTTHVMGVNGTFAYFLNFDRASMSVVDCSSQTVAATVTTAAQPASIAFSANAAYVAAGNNAISVVSIPVTEVSGSAGESGGGPTETLTLTDTAGVSCNSRSTTASQGQWVSLPASSDCQVASDVGGELLGWATLKDFPVEIAQRQVNNGWGAYELFNEQGRMLGVFIPAGGATFVSGSTNLYPIVSTLE